MYSFAKFTMYQNEHYGCLQEHMSSPPIFREVRVSLSLVFCLVLCRSLFVL